MDKVFALCGAAFFIAFALVAVMIGDETTAQFALMFLFGAGASQFVAQGGTMAYHIMANVFVALALLAAIIIIVKEVVFAGVTL